MSAEGTTESAKAGSQVGPALVLAQRAWLVLMQLFLLLPFVSTSDGLRSGLQLRAGGFTAVRGR